MKKISEILTSSSSRRAGSRYYRCPRLHVE